MSIDSLDSICIRRAEITDAVEIARLAGELGYPSTSDEIATRLRILLAHPDHFIAVAVANPSNLLGWIGAERRILLESGQRAELVGLVVDTTTRRSGIGKALVSAAEHWATTQGLQTISVRSNIARLESHPFYERMRYVRRKTQHSYTKQLFS